MAINIDAVYQQVLAIANKEQRGYITPQEFNLLARKAQLDIFESYFQEVRSNQMRFGNNTEYSDQLEILREKIAPFERYKQAMSGITSNELTLPTAVKVHKLGPVFFESIGATGQTVVDKVENEDLEYMLRNPKTAPTARRPVYVRKSATVILLFPSSVTGGYSVSNVTCDYVAKPLDPSWSYVVVNGKALFNSASSDKQDFQLHASEEGKLVNKILELAGIVIEKPRLTEAALRNDAINEAFKNR